MECHNYGNTITHGESQTSSIGMDNSYVKEMVELYNKNANIWQFRKLVNYIFSQDMKDAQSYTILIEHNDKSILGIN